MTKSSGFWITIGLILAAPRFSRAELPRVLDSGFQLELLAANPDIVTPVGLAFTKQGKLLVIESHTHFPPKDYPGPKVDRIRMLVKPASGDRPAQFSTWWEGSRATMSLAAGPDGTIFVATRAKLFRLRDTKNQSKADEEKTLVRLETKGDYPHNGLCGLAFDQEGRLLFGLGENLGEPYQLIGSDGTTLRGGGEGGNIYRCQADGSKLERLATGFWNPFGICVDPQGRVFTVENDPDSRPPCRLLHVVSGGDYGFQFRYGRAGVHPLQSWDGELPGTLPMVAGTGEAPCTVLPYHGDLWVSSWGDHRLERFELKQKGASWKAQRKIVVQGDHQFRPVGMAVGPDGALYFSDWVDRSYPVHGKGRLWRLTPKDGIKQDQISELTDAEKKAAKYSSRAELADLSSVDPFLHQAAIWGWSQHGQAAEVDWRKLADPRQRLGVLQARRWKEEGADQILHLALADEDPNVRLLAVRWVADRKLTKYRPQLLEQFKLPGGDIALQRGSLAALAWLDKGTASAHQFYFELAFDAKNPAILRQWALRGLPTNHKDLTSARLQGLLQEGELDLRREALWTLILSRRPERFEALTKLLTQSDAPVAMRADAVMGLADAPEKMRSVLQPLLNSSEEVVRREAERSLGKNKPLPKAPAPTDTDAWLKLTAGPGDADAGRRVFFSSRGPACYRCHAHGGRGEAIGPDLTNVPGDRRRLLESILQPSREIAPHYENVRLETADGKTHVGMSLGRENDGRKEKFLGSDGVPFILDLSKVVERQTIPTSIMPAGLELTLTPGDLRDLLAYLGGRK